jgi:2-hydroxychromene-2-carboxylate isomerase
MSSQWFFDFISPYAYLQFQELERIPGPAPRLRPVLFAGLLRHWGQLGPAEIPAKRRFTYRYALWRARDRGIPMRFPPSHPFNPLPLLRLAIALDGQPAAVGALFDAVWRDGLDPAESWPAICAAVGMSANEAADRIADDAVKAALRENTEEAVAAGVFGVPTLAVSGELFWGDDATAMASAWIADPEGFEDDEMRRVSDLPAAVHRRRD